MAEDKKQISQAMIDEQLVSWVVGTVEPWEQYRKTNFEDRWKEYYKEFKAIWTTESKTRGSERSKFISPAMAQAVEMAVAEMEEATFGRKNWIDIEDNLDDPVKTDAEDYRNRLVEDMELAQVPKTISEIYLNGAIYGTGIGKTIVSERTEIGPGGEEVKRPFVEEDAVSPWEFAIDPTAKNVNEGLGCAHIPVKSKIDILQKIEDGIYNDVPLGDFTDDRDVTSFGESRSNITGDKTEIIEYHGKVPAILLLKLEGDNDTVGQELAKGIYDPDEVDMVEAIVTIANREALLKAVENPFIRRDRAFKAYQHDTVPNRFWGRGICEKGIHSQRALNAELRARQDGLALTIHPMMAADATRLPRGARLEIAPGKQLLTNGDPNTILRPFHFGDMSNHTYTEAAELERMMQMATGSMDTATPIGISPRNQTAAGMSMISAGSIKRSKRTMRNIEEDFLKPMINKFLWRYQQFDPDRYPAKDYKMLPYSTMGIMAREFEQGQIAQVIQAVGDNQVARAILIEAFIDNSSINIKDDMKAALRQAMQPDPLQQQLQQMQLAAAQLDLQNKQLENRKLVAEVDKIYADIGDNAKQTDINAYNAIDKTQTDELDRRAFGREE